jgi:hypothetical protein
MPTIEIVSINSTGLRLKQENYEIAIREETELKSHRGLFYEFLIQQKGTIIHLGNPDFKNEEDGFFFGAELIDWDFRPKNEITAIVNKDETDFELLSSQSFHFQFDKQYKKEIREIMQLALESSQVGKIYILTDIQGGPVNATKQSGFSIESFWEMHNKSGLIYNRIYEIE